MAEPNKISDDQSMLDQVNAQASGQMDGVPQIQPVRPVVKPGEMQTAPQLEGDVAAGVFTFDHRPDVAIPGAPTQGLGTYDIESL